MGTETRIGRGLAETNARWMRMGREGHFSFGSHHQTQNPPPQNPDQCPPGYIGPLEQMPNTFQACLAAKKADQNANCRDMLRLTTEGPKKIVYGGIVQPSDRFCVRGVGESRTAPVVRTTPQRPLAISPTESRTKTTSAAISTPPSGNARLPALDQVSGPFGDFLLSVVAVAVFALGAKGVHGHLTRSGIHPQNQPRDDSL